jgi:hypothetical protein
VAETGGWKVKGSHKYTNKAETNTKEAELIQRFKPAKDDRKVILTITVQNFQTFLSLESLSSLIYQMGIAIVNERNSNDICKPPLPEYVMHSLWPVDLSPGLHLSSAACKDNLVPSGLHHLALHWIQCIKLKGLGF